MTSSLALQIAIVLGALAWKGQRLRASRQFIPATGATYAVVVALVACTLNVVLDLRGHRDGSQGLGEHLAQLAQNASLLATFFALQVLYLGYQREEGRRYSGRWEVTIVVGIFFVQTALTGWAVATGTSLYYSATGLRRPAGAVFFFLPTLYVLYATASQVVCGLRYAMQSKSRTRATALALTSFGVSLLFAATTVRTGDALRTVSGAGFSVSLRQTASSVIEIGRTTSAAGLVLPVVVSRLIAVINRVRAGKRFHDLEPLWILLTWAYPELKGPARPTSVAMSGHEWIFQTGGAGSGAPRTVSFLATSRLTECRDGYTMLRPYLNGDQDLPENDRVARAVHEIITTARDAVPAANSGDADPKRWRADLTDCHLVAISRALKSSDLSWCNTKEHV